MYDPLISKFLSGDPFVQDPTSGQNYNRYSYVVNNPMNKTDPTGFVYTLTQSMSQGFVTVLINNGPGSESYAQYQAAAVVLPAPDGSQKNSGELPPTAGPVQTNQNSSDQQVNQGAQGTSKEAPSAANSGGVIMPFLKKMDDQLAQVPGVGFLSPDSFRKAGDYWNHQGDVTGNSFYGYLGAGLSFIGDHETEIGGLIRATRGVGPRIGIPESEGFVPSENVTGPYVRPSGAGPTAEQRASVQGQPCVECGALSKSQVADHKDPLVVQYYREGKVNIEQQKSVDAVQSHCPSCSAEQGGYAAAFSRAMSKLFGF